ncbi:5-oxoprolinase subunit PxpB [Bacillus sp. USDA818B3_A]|uniref:5-oxoprolinase subunit PxpB n=1 Tax=Bacillus sp. USDA818B3_A TaxID=2698834 RepID=UPI0013698CB8|nr:5-oxoprolinase subunit PxpB [Bacillus sp. USDA818B3_A]
MIEIHLLGDSAVSVSFGNEINEVLYKEIQQFISRVKQANLKGVVEFVPSYCTVAIYYKPEIINFYELEESLKSIYHHQTNLEQQERVVYEVPVYYGGTTGPDLTYVANYHQLSEEAVIRLHTSQEYLIYMMGFVPGFPYLGGLPPSLAVPRLDHPRPKVQAGSVGIGGNQTGIYPAEVPSGWRIIGITPVPLFDIERPSPFLFSAGDYIKFYSVDFKEYKEIQQLLALKAFEVKTYKKE